MRYSTGSCRPVTLGGDGVEHYDGFFRSFRDEDVAPIVAAMAATGQVSSMLCFSPDFTDPDERRRRTSRGSTRRSISPSAWDDVLPTLSGQNPGLSARTAWRAPWKGCCDRSSAERRGVTLCLENHYKDGTWHSPSSRSPGRSFRDPRSCRFTEPRGQSRPVERDCRRLRSDPFPRSRAAGRHDARVRSLAGPRATLAELRQSDGTIGYSDKLRHGEVGKGRSTTTRSSPASRAPDMPGGSRSRTA